MTAARAGRVSEARLKNTLHHAEMAQRNYEAAQRDVAAAMARRKAAMKRCVTDGISQTETAALFGVTRGYVSNVIAGRQGK